MPPRKKYDKEKIIHVAMNIVENEGFSGINARRIAKEIGASVQPIFHNFASMEELEKVLYENIYEKYKEYMLRGREKTNPYKEMGLNYIDFAMDYPEFFKIILMQQTDLESIDFLMYDDLGNEGIEVGRSLTGLSYEEQKKFHLKVWVFTHGIACLVATKTVKFSKQEISDLLESAVREMLIGYKKGKI